MNKLLLSFPRPLFFLASMALFFACHLSNSSKTEPVFDFPTLKAAIGDADHATIVLTDSAGKVIDTLFHAQVNSSTTFRGLAAPHYYGGKAVLQIEASKKGEVIYKVERQYDGKAGGNQGKVILISPGTTVNLEWLVPQLREGDSVPLPSVKILPQNLSNKDLSWISRQAHLLAVTKTHLKGLTPGMATLVVVLKSDTTKKDSLAVDIFAKDSPKRTIDSLRLTPDPLILAVRGPTGRFTVHPYPSSAHKEVTFTTLDTTLFSLSPEGLITPKAEGQGKVRVVSTADSSIIDTATVQVLPAQKIDSIRFDRDSLEIFVKGTAELLPVQVYPPLGNPNVFLASRDMGVAKVEDGKVAGFKEGETWIQAKSIEDGSKIDSIRIFVFPAEKVDSVRVKPDTVRLYVGGTSEKLTAFIDPATPKSRFTWHSQDPKVATVDANGLVSPRSEGKVFVSVHARADSAKKDSSLILVKKDTPRLFVGVDTAVAAGATVSFNLLAPQEYGTVVLFKWDLLGDGVWEDSTTTVRSSLSQAYLETKEYSARFYVRDSEGNDTLVSRKIRAVQGRVVQITSPQDGAYVNVTPIQVTWTVDGQTQSNSQAVVLGANTITRLVLDSSGKAYSHSITVHLDQTPPNRPMIKAPAVPVNTLTPHWDWSSGGGGGNGTFRYRLDNSDLGGGAVTSDTFLEAPLSPGSHTLFLQERDEAGNWSPTANAQVRIDTTPPPAPEVSVSPTSPSRNPRPTWSWTGGTGDAHRFYRYKLDNDDFRTVAKDTSGTSFTPAMALTDTVHTLYVQERDSAGNWSAPGSRSITIDTWAPTAPTVSVLPSALTNDETPTWSWTPGTGGNGTFRWKLNDANLESGATETAVLNYTPASGLGTGNNTLYVQEEDAAGNWSAAGSKQVHIDLTPPGAPRIDSTPYSPLNSLRPKWTWRSGAGGAKVFRARVDNLDLSGSLEQGDTSFTPPGSDLTEGNHTLHVQERDSAGNWSTTASRTLFLSLRGQLGDFLSRGPISRTTSIVLNASDKPFVAYCDVNEGYQVRVKTLTPLGWELAGVPPLNEGPAESIRLFLDKNNRLNLTYKEFVQEAGRYKLHMRWYNGSGWNSYGDDVIRLVMNSDEVFSFVDGNSVPYIAYMDWVDTTDGWNQIFILKFNGNSWEPHSTLIAQLSGFVVDSQGRPIVAGGSVYRYNLSTKGWDILSNGLPESARVLSMAIDREGNPAVLFRQGGGEFIAKLKSDAWEVLGTNGYSTTSGQDQSFAFGPENTPYVAYQAYEFGYAVIIKTLIGDRWVSIGPPGKTIGHVPRPGIAITKAGIPFISHESQSNGRAAVTKISFDLP